MLDVATYSRKGRVDKDSGCVAGGVGINSFSRVGSVDDSSVICARGRNTPAIRVCNPSGVIRLVRASIDNQALAVGFGGGASVDGDKGLRVEMSSPSLGRLSVCKSKGAAFAGKVGDRSRLRVSVCNSKGVDKGDFSYAGLTTHVCNSKGIGLGEVDASSARMGVSNSKGMLLSNGSARTRCRVTNSKSVGTARLGMRGIGTHVDNSNDVEYCTARGLAKKIDNDKGMTCGNGPRVGFSGEKLRGLWVWGLSLDLASLCRSGMMWAWGNCYVAQ